MLKQHFKPSTSAFIRDLVAAFLQHHFLHWLEASSLLGVVTNGVLSLTRLRNTIPVSTSNCERHINRYLIVNQRARNDKFVTLIEDAYRFILHNRWIIEQAPLQTYVSALLFTPAASIIRDLFKAEEPSWVLTKPVVERSWSPCLQIFEGRGGPVASVAFSADGSRVVSVSKGETIRIWDTKLGRKVHELDGHSDTVTSAAFSPDGSRIVSGSWDTTIRIWDIKSAKESHELDGHNDTVTSVAFSPDGSRIVSGSADMTIWVWDAKLGKEMYELQGHSDSVTSVAFSPDGTRIYRVRGRGPSESGMPSWERKCTRSRTIARW